MRFQGDDSFGSVRRCKIGGFGVERSEHCIDMHPWLRSCGRGPPLLFMRRCAQLGACRGSALPAVEGRPFLE
eukprot:3677786-Pyramimonas_sp.AAC.1